MLQNTVLSFLNDGNSFKKQALSNSISTDEEEEEEKSSNEKSDIEEEDLFNEFNAINCCVFELKNLTWPQKTVALCACIILKYTPPPKV